jgi:hypothetical protein
MNQRNAKLLEERYSTHPLRADIQSALASAEKFADRASEIKVDRNLSAEGRSAAITKQLKSALRDIRDSSAPIDAMKTKLAAIQAAVKMPPVDRTDTAGALARQELRAALRGMPMGDRAALLLGQDADVRWVDAVLEQPSVLSGTPPELYLQAKTQRLESLFAAEIAEGENLDQQISEGEAGLQLARQDLAKASGLNEREFEAMELEVNSRRNAVWLRIETDVLGNERTVVVPIKGGASRPATEAERRDGKFFASLADYQAHRAA